MQTVIKVKLASGNCFKLELSLKVMNAKKLPSELEIGNYFQSSHATLTCDPKTTGNFLLIGQGQYLCKVSHSLVKHLPS